MAPITPHSEENLTLGAISVEIKPERESSPQVNSHDETIIADTLLFDEFDPYYELQKVLKPLGLKIKDVLGDGNCLFRALSDQLYGHEERHERIRQKICDYLEKHKSYFTEFFFSEDETFEEHVSNMRELRTYGDNLELAAFANMFFVDIHIYQAGRKDALVISGIDLESEKSRLKEDKPVLHIVYHDWEHYSSVRFIKKSPDTSKARIKNKEIIVPSPKRAATRLNRVNDSISLAKIKIISSNGFPQEPLTDCLSYDPLLLTETSDDQVNLSPSPIVTLAPVKSREASPEIFTPSASSSFSIDSIVPTNFSRVRRFEDDSNLIHCSKRRKLSNGFTSQ